MYSLKAREEEIKSRVREDYFGDYDCSNYLGNIDFSVAIRKDGKELFPDKEYLMWAEAKPSNHHPLWESFIQLILTIGKEKTREKAYAPKFLGAFDAEKLALIPYVSVEQVFAQNDFNWNVTPSNHNTKEFEQLKKLVRAELDKSGKEGENVFVFYYDNDSKELKKFIRKNFVSGRDAIQRMRVSPNNFTSVYETWRKEVMPTITVDWKKAREKNILESDFFLADLISTENKTILEKLKVLLTSDKYILKNKIDDDIFSIDMSFIPVEFSDNRKAHSSFWAKYARPPKEQYWEYMVDRRDLLIPQDVRERKGSYFTPKIWVEKAQGYIADYLGDNWQEEYYVWDCCAGTGNLLQYLSNKYNIWASTLDDADVAVMQQQIESAKSGARLLPNHIFQFDFLNDDFKKLPSGLQEIINDEEKRKHLVIFINPPYGESGAHFVKEGGKKNIALNKIHDKYKDILSDANREMYAQFLMRIYMEIPSCIIAEFSKCKTLSGSHFSTFRKNFAAKLEKMFIVPSWTFDNIKGKFPIGFKIWNTGIKEVFTSIDADVYDEKGVFIGTHNFNSYEKFRYFSSWVAKYRKKSGLYMGWLACVTLNDFQSQRLISILNDKHQISLVRGAEIYDSNIIEVCVSLAVRQCIDASWINDRDQFLFPSNKWYKDNEFKTDCLVFSIFHGQNRISSELGINHWIPFSEEDVNSPDKFKSNFMSNLLSNKGDATKIVDLFGQRECFIPTITPAAQDVLNVGKELWYYYLHHKDNVLYGASSINVNASFYDIRKYFQGVDEKGKMNSDSSDQEYMRLIKDLREKQKVLAKQIEEKVYKYGFLYNGEPREDDDIVEVEAEEVVTPAVIKKEAPIKKKKKEQTIIVQNIQVNGDLNVQTLIGSADIKK